MAAIPALKVVAPSNKKRTVGRKANAKYRTREHLTEREVERLVEAAKGNRWGHRDATMVLIAFRHGLRDLKGGVMHVRRVKQGIPATHPLTGRELRALRRLERDAAGSPFVFVSERRAPFSTRGFQAMVERAAQAAGFDMKIHPHMLRHACGYNKGVAEDQKSEGASSYTPRGWDILSYYENLFGIYDLNRRRWPKLCLARNGAHYCLN
jgi:integrase